MSKFLLDTTVLIDFSKGHEPVKSYLLAMLKSDDDIGVCAINITEFYAGLRSQYRNKWKTFFDSLLYWNITREAAAQAGSFRYDFKKSGQQLTTTDTLVAATALQEGAILVTNNVKDYPMKELTLLQINTTQL